MATAHAADFSVVLAAAGSTVKDMAVSLLHAQRTGIPTIVTWQSWWKQVQEEDPNVQQKMDVLSITTTLPTAPSNHFPKLKRSNEKGEMQDKERRPQQTKGSVPLVKMIPKMAQLLQPKVVLIQVTPTHQPKLLLAPAGEQHYELEKALYAVGYNVDAQCMNSARVGGLVSEQSYWIVAHKVAETAMEWPTEQDQFGGVQHILQPNVDVRLRRDDYSKTKSKFTGMFQPKQVGYSQGGGVRRGRAVHDHAHPLPDISEYYDPITRENGGGCVTKPNGGARVMLQT
jgi:hypothetical protein